MWADATWAKATDSLAHTLGIGELGGWIATTVPATGVASKMGVLPGDALLSIDGNKIQDEETFRVATHSGMHLVELQRAGAHMLTVLRADPLH